MLKPVPGLIFCGASAIFLAHGRSFIFPMASAARIRIPPFELRGNFCYCVHASLSLPTSTHRSQHYEWHRRYVDYGRPRPFKADRRGRPDYKKNKGSINLNQYGNTSFRYLIRCALDHSLACSLAHSLLARSIVRSLMCC